MAVIGGIFLCALLIGMGCLIWYKRGLKIEEAAKKVAGTVASDVKAAETRAQATVRSAEQAIKNI
jgi:hypothetical protein